MSTSVFSVPAKEIVITLTHDYCIVFSTSLKSAYFEENKILNFFQDNYIRQS